MSYKLQTTSLWKFEDRGSWSTHRGDYRGNWSPHIPRNLILKYTNIGETVLDPFLGSGTTLIECKLLDRHGIGIDINPNSIQIAISRTNFDSHCSTSIFQADSSDISFISKNSIDLICLHPPYANIIKYSDIIEGDLSHSEPSEFIKKLQSVSSECYRVLKENKYCCMMMGDIRKKGHIVPLGFQCMQTFIDEGFFLKEIIIKEQFNTSRESYWKSKANLSFYILAHEYIFIFRK